MQFIAGASVFAIGVLFGAGIAQANMNRLLKGGDREEMYE